MSRTDMIESGRYVVRCSLAAVVSYLFALHLRLPFPVWAPISALVVSQESLITTHHSVDGRIAGTVLGVMVAVMVDEIGTWLGGAPQAVELAVGVAICAIAARLRPAVRVGLWTCPLVLLTTSPGVSVEMTALFRGSEVAVGAAVAGLVHYLEDRGTQAVFRLLRRKGWMRVSEDRRPVDRQSHGDDD
ncbi:FUSC family protein [Telmatospirillum sp.]|uniref:FUSC family protein n=1 Tax=Telmatospirillum sp. TaxID=2079197 RepID=UPI002848A1C6|nr:FUSC family protein [Telmatospirillum sp.]MDR3439444.1 FUSC family protein [Telmatospirillum sp.]